MLTVGCLIVILFWPSRNNSAQTSRPKWLQGPQNLSTCLGSMVCSTRIFSTSETTSRLPAPFGLGSEGIPLSPPPHMHHALLSSSSFLQQLPGMDASGPGRPRAISTITTTHACILLSYGTHRGIRCLPPVPLEGVQPVPLKREALSSASCRSAPAYLSLRHLPSTPTSISFAPKGRSTSISLPPGQRTHNDSASKPPPMT